MKDWTPDPFLIGNGLWCSTCFPKGPPVGMSLGATWRKKARPGCNECGGAGRIAFTAEEIIAAAVAAKAIPRRAAIAAAASLLLLVLSGPRVEAHDWYPSACCSGQDCRIASPDEIVETKGGWRVVPTGEFYRYDQAPPSPDGKFHRCLKVPTDVSSRTLCIFVPAGAS